MRRSRDCSNQEFENWRIFCFEHESHGFNEFKKITIMKLLDKIEKFNIEARTAEENYKAMGADREQHQKRMLEFIHQQMKKQEGERRK